MADPNSLLQLLTAPDPDGAAPPIDKTDALIGMLKAPVGTAASSENAAPVPSQPKKTGFFSDIQSAYNGEPQDPDIKNLGIIRPQARLKSGALRLAAPGIIQDTARTIGQFGRSISGDATDDETQSAARNMAGMVVGGAAVPEVTGATKAGLAAAKDAVIAPLPKILSADELQTAAKAAYKTADDAGVVVKPEAFNDFVSGLRRDMHNTGYDSDLHKNVSVAMKRLNAAVDDNVPQSFSDLERLRRVASEARQMAASDGEYAKASAIVGGIDKFVKEAPPESLYAGDAAKASAAAENARSLWSRSKKIEDIQDIAEIANRTEDPDKYIKQQFTRITKDNDRFNQFNPDEQKLIVSIAKTGPMGKVGNALAPSADKLGMLKTIMLGGAGVASGVPLAGPALSAAGIAAQMAAKSGRLSNISDLTNLISQGGPTPSVLERIKAARAQSRITP